MCDLGPSKSEFYAKQPITAYRLFRKYGKSLKAVYQDTLYHSGFPFYEAKGINYTSWAPGGWVFTRKAEVLTQNREGFHSFKSLERAKYWAKGWEGGRVVARVLLFGKIVRHRYGYRSEFMFIDEVLAP